MIRSLLAACMLLGLAVSAAVSTPAYADNWPQWRGPHNNGVCEEKNLPTKFDKALNLAWRFPLPGPASSTPVIWGDHIYLTSPEKDTLPRFKQGPQGRGRGGRGGRRGQAEQQPRFLRRGQARLRRTRLRPV